jgi:hypothetical protein|tara:strand:+ start:373 stop:579 length:207 start_codon:yes stop_codon:yes gene_type:complete
VTDADEIAERLARVRRLDRILNEFVEDHDTHNVRLSSFAERAYCPKCDLLWSVAGSESIIEPVYEITE